MEDFLEGISDSKADDMYRQIMQIIAHFSNPENAAFDKRWNKNDDFQSHGISGEIYKTLLKRLRNPIQSLPFEERLKVAQKLVLSKMNEQAGVANLVLSLSTGFITPDHFDYLGEHVGSFCSWGMTDSFCIDVLQPVLGRFPDAVIELLKKWNCADNQWKRRASVVAFTRKIGASGFYTEPALALCENLLWDEEYYVQKGVGWALKDVMRGEKDNVFDYVKDLRRRGVSSIITLYAIKDLVDDERQEVLSIKTDGHIKRISEKNDHNL